MSSEALYQRIYSANIERIKSGQIEVDDNLSARATDSRRGVSLVIPIRGVSDPYRHLVKRLSALEPNQYYYPVEDLHITVFDFLQARAGYERNAPLEDTFLGLSREVAWSTKAFDVKMRGVVFSGAAGMIKGYDDDSLVSLRGNIRRLMEFHGLTNDERYKSESAHVTFTRFQNPLVRPGLFVDAIQELSEIELGEEHVSHFELVEHDWYNSLKTKRVIGEIFLTS